MTTMPMAHAGSAVLDKKLKKVLELRTDTPVMLEALDCISEFWTDNTLEARRGLRHELEHENLVLSNKFIESFSPLQARIQEVDRVVDKLDKSNLRRFCVCSLAHVRAYTPVGTEAVPCVCMCM